ncbi:MAG: calcium-binding protein [Streptococcus sp.]|nr:MAG: calcium-binding protein [Streptococcus sp.]
MKKVYIFIAVLLSMVFINVLSVSANDGGVEMYRMYNPNSGEHFYTASWNEKEMLVGVGWHYEGIGWIAPLEGQDVYRMYNPNAGDHHYTLNANERDFLIRAGWRYEGVSWKSSGQHPLYRLYNPNAKAGSHHYTLSEGEKDYLVQVGWRYEGISWNAIGLGKPASHSSNNSSVENHSDTISESGIYPNCEAARRAGVTPIYRGQPGYSSKLDKDGDGVACEK